MFQWITLYENWSSCITFLQTKLHTMLILSWLIPGDSLVANNANLSTYILHVCHNIIMSRLWNKGRDRVRDSYFCQRTPEESQYFVSLNRRGSPGTPNFQIFISKPAWIHYKQCTYLECSIIIWKIQLSLRISIVKSIIARRAWIIFRILRNGAASAKFF